MIKKILFIDRDGTLIHEPSISKQVNDLKQIIFEPFVIVSLVKLIKYGFELVLITNQDGLGSKNYSIQQFSIVQNFILKVLSTQGINFRTVLICPHLKIDQCNCRKPNLGLVKYWLKKNKISKEHSYVIGDRITDIQLANNMQIKSILYHRKKYPWNKITQVLTSLNRYAVIKRITKETQIFIKIFIDQKIKSYTKTGIFFFDHMLEQIRVHSGISWHLTVFGDLEIDDHHIIEDVGIALGLAFKKSLSLKYGISRYGFTLPMDESLASCFLDISGRSYFSFYAKFKNCFIGDLKSEMVEHFFRSFSMTMKITLHLHAIGLNDHHCVESLFKVFGRTLKQAIVVQGRKIPTSKGVL
ncbi:bifunctional histidinol-phosphatase/imidazoleglycerol-phosphate dehydratase HisB [Buchnera aphidicola]|uniref:Imidazoleglycerol-phosphate dehydratase n=1 Tax=Buchnera aphidicola subsp. Tuberolachnus salignus TaxID=98804 RepID=A0A170PBI9_BUCTT|nr:bifunctional histidinol-phosphatase/imidazoleglycerol-phosphate dehydratase HisB [Buchnera aphidicola]CUR53053.1 Histidine biosynthesis bifunctional protein HisB [Buchnera aphidicola (Tuberolachnus salignus)]